MLWGVAGPGRHLDLPRALRGTLVGPLETDEERNAAAEERRRVLPPESPTPVRDAQAQYSPPQTRGRWVLVLLGVTIAADLLSLAALGAQGSLLNRGAGNISVSQWQTSVHRVQHLSAVELLLYIATAIAFFLWLHRCYVNLTALPGRALRFTRGGRSATGSFHC